MDSSLQPQRSFPIMPVLIGGLALGTVMFAGLFIYYFGQASTATSTLNQAKRAALLSGAAQQKKLDAAAAEKVAEIPYRTYQAPSQFGSFAVNFPKNWSARVSESIRAQTQVNLSVNPDFIRYTDDAPQAVALRVRLIQQSSSAFIGIYAEEIKQGTLKKSTMTVSGQNATVLTGHFKDNSGTAEFSRLVAVPVRDKVVVFTCENDLYLDQFATAVAQSKIIP